MLSYPPTANSTYCYKYKNLWPTRNFLWKDKTYCADYVESTIIEKIVEFNNWNYIKIINPATVYVVNQET